MPQDFMGIVVLPIFSPVVSPTYPFLINGRPGLTLGLLRGLEDRPVEAPLTLRDLFPGEIFFLNQVCDFHKAQVSSPFHTPLRRGHKAQRGEVTCPNYKALLRGGWARTLNSPLTRHDWICWRGVGSHL